MAETATSLAVADALASLRVPARLVWGTADPFQKIEYGKRFAHDVSAPLHPINRGRHFTPEDHPESVAQEINQLLADVRQQA